MGNNANPEGVSWLSPSSCLPPHRVARPEQVEALAAAFREAGWDVQQPALVGYPWGEGIQLLSGTHRHAAAAQAGIKIPVKIVPYREVQWSWGHLERWLELMRRGDGLTGE